jgi:predicted tellurium resistance membrane protein TerC
MANFLSSRGSKARLLGINFTAAHARLTRRASIALLFTLWNLLLYFFKIALPKED